MIVGSDISYAQGNINWKVYSQNTNFVLMKATEGNGLIDAWLGNNRTQARNYHLPLGFYHYSRADLGNSGKDEANYFLKILSGDPVRPGEILALDYEVSYSGDPVAWCKEWLDTVSASLNGVKPLLYLNQSLIKGYDWSPVVTAGYGLWVADYTFDPNKFDASIGAWPYAAFQQWTDKQIVPGVRNEVDGDVFFGDATAFYKYGYQLPIVPPAPLPPVSIPPTQVPPSTPPVVVPPVSPCGKLVAKIGSFSIYQN